MYKTGRFFPGVLAGVIACSVCPALAQDWAKAMFNHTSHDFGVVARGAKVEHSFVVENIYEEDAHIVSAEASCACSVPKITKNYLKTWEKAEIVISLDTRGFLGRKDATITVKFDKPFPAEVQLHVHAYIRSDIVVQPGVISFGSVAQGVEATQTVNIAYAGRQDWQIKGVECNDPNLEISFIETKREAGQVGYSLSARLKPTTPAGYIREQIVLITNDTDAKAARVPVAVEGIVTAALSIRPSPLFMGVVEPGQSVTRTLVVQGQTPFKIISVKSTDERFQFKLPIEVKTVQVIPVTFTGTPQNAIPGESKVSAKITIVTDLASAKSTDVDVSVQLAPRN